MNPAICAFETDVAPAGALAKALGLRLHVIEMHRFPDGESLPRAPSGDFDPLIVYCALDRPDPKLMPLLLLADAARRACAGRLILVAPYMPYLRQDVVFRPGEPVSLEVIGKLLGGAFDVVLTVQPHLHRTHNLAAAFHPAKVKDLSAAEPLAHVIGAEGDPVIVGPDTESAPWVRSIAARLGAASLVLSKSRSGDREVEVELARAPVLAGRRLVLIDDICSTGGTLKEAVRALRRAGAAHVEIFVVHALIAEADLGELMSEGVALFVSTDSCPHHTNRVSLSHLLARRLRMEIACPARN